MPRISLVTLGFAALLASCVREEPEEVSQRKSLFTSESFNGRNYRLYVPASYSAGHPIPLVMMLHGCTQNPDQIAAGTQFNVLAESQGFLVLYPEQPTSEDSNHCWLWWEAAHQSRGSGEPMELTDLVHHVGDSYTLDKNRVFVGGLSSGAAMAVILGATYPDVYAAIAVGSGLEYKSASGATLDALLAMSNGGPSPVTEGRAAYAAMGAAHREVAVIVFHGTADHTVAPINAEQIVSQWAKTDDLASDGSEDNNVTDTADSVTSGTVSGGRSYTTSIYRDHKTGAVAIEKVLVSGMGHAWSGGSTAGSYTDPQGPNATALSWEFFMAHPIGGISLPDGGTPVDAGVPDLSRPDLAVHDLGVPDLAVSDLSHVDAAPVDAGASTVTLRSIDSEDGYVGALPADGTSKTTLKVGDKGMFSTDTYRGLLSFDASALPVGAHPTSAQLVLYRKAQAGNVSSLSVDVKSGYFGGSAALLQEDYAAAATLSGVTSFAPPAKNGDAVTVNLPAAALSALVRGARLQLRLHATTPVDFNADAIELYDGSDARYAPTLILSY